MRYLVVLALPGERSPDILTSGTDDLAEAQSLAGRAMEMADYWARDVVGGYPGVVTLIDTAEQSLDPDADLGFWVGEREEGSRL